MRTIERCLLGALAVAAILSVPSARLAAQQTPAAAVTVGTIDLGGVVNGPNGPEAGVWVIAETTDLPTKFAKIVVTDERGRYLLPELPKANYKVWVRGYGLVDSPKVDSEPGKILDLTAVTAPSPTAAAEYYPAIYWFSMLGIPDKNDFPGTGSGGNGIPATIKSQAMWLDGIKTDGCVGCHQIGNKATRTIEKAFGDGDSYSAWVRRVQSGQASRLHDPQYRHARHPARAQDSLPTGPIESPPANCRKPSRSGRKASSAMSSDRVGLGRAQDVSARPDRDRPAQADGQRQRPDLWLAGMEHGLRAGARSGEAHGLRHQDSGARSEDPVVDQRSDVRAVALLGRASRSGTARRSPHNPMLDDKGRVWFTASAFVRPQTAGFLPEGIRSSVRQGVSGRARPGASSRCTIRRRRNSR